MLYLYFALDIFIVKEYNKNINIVFTNRTNSVQITNGRETMKKRFFKRLTAGALALLMIGTALPSGSDFSGLFSGSVISASAEGEVNNNRCGKDAHWSLSDTDGDGENDKLSITGTGDMYNYTDYRRAPWYGDIRHIKSIDIERGITSIGDYVFTDCRSLLSVTIPESVTSIGKHAFAQCITLTSVTIPTGVTSIGEFAFDTCLKLTSVRISESVTSIGDSAFNACTSCTDVYMTANPRNLTWRRKDNEFMPSRATKCHVPERYLNYYRITFDDFNLTFIPIDQCGDYAKWSLIDTNHDRKPDKLTISGTGAMWDFNSVNMPWYENRNNIISIEIDSGITAIGEWAFSCCGFTTVDIPESVTSIGGYAFSGSKITNLTIPSGVTVINDGLFQDCEFLESIAVQNGVTSIGKSAFSGCGSLKTIVISSTVTSIDNNAFQECTAVDNVLLDVADPGKLTWNYDSDDFNGEKETKCHVPKGTLAAYNAKFGDANVTFVGDLETYKCGEQALWDLTDTDKDGVKDKLTIFGTGAMWDYNFINNKAPWYDNKDNIKSVEIANGITSIGNFAFNNCSALTTVTIPKSITKIGEGAFSYCSALESVTIPANVTAIGNHAFTGCTACTDVYMNIADPTSLNWDGDGSEFITETPKATRCHVQKGTLAAYKERFDSTVNVTFIVNVNVTIENNIEDGKVTASKMEALSGDEIILTVTTRENYKLKSLTVTDSTNNPVEVTNYKFTMPDLDVTVSAEFEPINYKVHFDKNGGTGTMADEPFTYGTAKALTENSFTRTGYTFAGWNTEANGTGTAYADKESVNNLTTTDDATVTLYAQWTLDTYTIIYDLDGGTNNAANPASYDVNTATIILADPTKTGYTFGGWYDNSSFTGTAVTTIDNGSAGNKTLYAKWTLDTYTITYNLDGGTNNIANPESYNVNTKTITLADPTKTGYTFGGWYDNSSFTGTDVTTIAKGSTGDRTLFAKWTINKYTIEFVNYDYTVLQTSSVTYGETPVYTGATPVKEDTLQYIYTFKGWDKTITAVTGNKTYKATYNSTVNKTSLNSAIMALDSLNKTINDDEIYKDMYESIAMALKQAQEVADNENATVEQVSEQTKTLNDMIGEFDAVRKLVKDSYEANKVAIIINELPEPSKVDKSDKEAIEAARAAYDALTQDQKAILGNTKFPEKLSDDEAALATVLKRIDITRLAGKTRYSTAVEISKAGFPDGAKTAILAYGLNYADALAGVSLASAVNAPTLLTDTNALPDETLEEIKRLGAKEIIILGGEGAVGKAVENEINALGLYTERIAGGTRFETVAKIAKKIQVIKDKTPEDIFFVYAFNSADALSVSAVAAVKGAPIIYLNTKGELDDATSAYLASVKGKVKNAYVIGGSGVISDDMMKKAGDALGVKPTRVFGKDRFETCVAVNEKFAEVLNGDYICAATGMDFPDALAGGAFAAQRKAPLFLVNNTLKDAQRNYLTQKNAHNFYVFGGTGAVSDELVTEMTALSR